MTTDQFKNSLKLTQKKFLLTIYEENISIFIFLIKK
jgi:hypothetical protein